jgi:hypothetical protein
MTAPRFATWLLRHFGCGSNNDAVMGDLAERYARGKTAAWYWQQVGIALVVGAFQDIRGHKFLTLRGVAVAWAISYLSGKGFWALLLLNALSPVEMFWTLSPWIASWTLPDFVSVYQLAIYVLIPLVTMLIAFACGWITTKLYGPHHRSILLMLVAAYLLLAWPYAMSNQDYIAAPSLWRANYWMQIALQVIALLVCAASSRKASPRDQSPRFRAEHETPQAQDRSL